MNGFKCNKCDGDIELSYGMGEKFIFEKCLKCGKERGFSIFWEKFN
jgi:translation initiation factor 2 beta subunit (eIF-2beta)/eIF-5